MRVRATLTNACNKQDRSLRHEQKHDLPVLVVRNGFEGERRKGPIIRSTPRTAHHDLQQYILYYPVVPHIPL